MFEENKIIQYIAQNQQKDGGFISFSSNSIDNFTESTVYRTNFITAIISEVLSQVTETPYLYQIKRKSADFLLSQKSDHWSWNYWSKFSKEFTSMPYPDDLDDTFCALNALYMFDKKLITGSAYAHIVQLLTSLEKKEGGPYKTWLASKNASGWDDVDIVVNSNIAYFLWMQETTLPNVQSFFEDRLQKSEIQSKYYPSIYPFLYFLSRFYPEKKKIENILLENSNKNGYWENPLYTALAILALLNGKFSPKKLEKSIAYLLKQQERNHWGAYAFCIDPTQKGMKHYAGSPVLTTAFCLAAISKYQQMIDKKQNFEKKVDKGKQTYLKKIFSKKVFLFADKNLTKQNTIIMEEIASKDKSQQIPLMPYYFLKALNKRAEKIKDNDIVLLGRANVFGWLAYTIYDDFLDEEGDPQLLPLANIYLRRLTQIFDTTFIAKENVASYFHHVLDKIENANSWEVSQCRLPIDNGVINPKELIIPDFGDLRQLAHKSLGHGLGPLTILMLLGYTNADEEFVYVYKFFLHYLIARQLHDDAHDWEDDLLKGHMTFAVALLLTKAKKNKIITTKKTPLKTIFPKLQKIFWYEIIEEICSHIHAHVNNAREALYSSSIIANPQILENLLQVYEDGADKALEERKKTIDFLQAYK